MGWLDAKCAMCGSVIAKPFEGLVVSTGTGRTYKNTDEFNAAKEKFTDISLWCKNCAITGIKQLEELKLKLDDIVITTTSTIEGRDVTQYKGIVTAQVFMGVNVFKDIFSGVRDLVGGRSKAMESELNKAKDLLISEIKAEALHLNANAIIGLKIDFEDVGKTSGNAFMLLGVGTAVISESKPILQ